MAYSRITIDKMSSLPIVQQIANSISRQILNEQLSPGNKLPTERELAEELKISRGTVKRAYTKLAQAKVIEIRQGSGSYVLTNGKVLELSQKKEAAEIIAATLFRLQAMGLSDKEIYNLFNLHLYTREDVRKINIMVLSNNHEILSELEKQLSYLSSTSLFFFTLSFFTLDNIKKGHDAERMLKNYDLIIATSIDYAAVADAVPMFQHKIIEAAISPRTNTLIEISTIPKNSRITVIYRTETFLRMVRQTLLTMGFQNENIFSWQELSYNPVSHSENGVCAVINFNESPVYVDPAFYERNQEFLKQGGKLIHFEYRIDRNSLTYIEDRIQALLPKKPLMDDEHSFSVSEKNDI